MPKFDTLIKGGTIVDGTGSPRFVGDIGIKDGIITDIGAGISGDASDVIDGTGKIVAPGVIDAHTHYDAQLHWDPYATNSGWHGTTTIGVGNCGFGFAPCHPQDRERYMQMMETTEQVPVNAMRTALGWDWVSFPEWIEHLKRVPKGVNVASYVPLNPLLIYVMGLEAAKSRPATAEERERMKQELHAAMDAGAIGFGFSYQGEHNTHIDCDGTPMPSDTMSREDILALAEVLRERGEGSIQALVDTPGARFGEIALEVARVSGRPVLHNVVIVNDFLPTYHEEVLALIDKAREEGLEIFTQTLTTRGWNEFKPMDWDIWNIIPEFREFTFAGDRAAKVAKAADEDYRTRLRNVYRPELLAPAGGPLEHYVLNDACGVAPWNQYEGKSVGEIAAAVGNRPTIDVFMPLEVMHYKLSAVPAEVLGLHNRGTLAAGQAADLFIYDYEALDYPRLKYEIAHDLPDGDWRRVCKPQGIERVMVNGETTFVNGTECTGATPGRLVGSGGADMDEQLMHPMAIAAE